jgi:hypothetical protein
LFRTPGIQGLAFAVLLSLGFWGFAIFFLAFYTEDANHFLYAAVAGITALGWTLILARRWLALRRHAGVR